LVPTLVPGTGSILLTPLIPDSVLLAPPAKALRLDWELRILHGLASAFAPCIQFFGPDAAIYLPHGHHE